MSEPKFTISNFVYDVNAHIFVHILEVWKLDYGFMYRVGYQLPSAYTYYVEEHSLSKATKIR